MRDAIPTATIISFSGTNSDAPWADVAILKDNGGIDEVERAVAAAIAEPAVAEDADLRTFIHDMRNPVGALIGFVHLIKTQKDRMSEEQFESIIDGIERSATRLSGLLEELAAQQDR